MPVFCFHTCVCRGLPESEAKFGVAGQDCGAGRLNLISAFGGCSPVTQPVQGERRESKGAAVVLITLRKRPKLPWNKQLCGEQLTISRGGATNTVAQHGRLVLHREG